MKITVKASRWEYGWELWLDDDNLISVPHLVNAQRQVRDYLDTVAPEVDHSTWVVNVVPAEDLAEAIVPARQATIMAAMAQAEAAKMNRQVVQQMLSSGITVTDAAVLMGITKSRVSKLGRG